MKDGSYVEMLLFKRKPASENMGKKKRSNLSLGSTCCGLCLSQVQPAVDAEPVGGEASLYWTFRVGDLPLVNLGILGVLKPFSRILRSDCIAHRGTASAEAAKRKWL